MESKKERFITILLLLIFSAATSIIPQNFPDLSIVLLIYLSLKYESTSMLLWAFLSGIIHDGFNFNQPWIFPLLYPALFLVFQKIKENLNITFLPVKIFTVFITSMVLFLVYSVAWSIPINLIIIKTLSTTLLNILIAALI